MTSVEYFKKQLGRLRRSLYYAEQRNDENAIKGLRDKMRHYRAALEALEAHEREGNS